LDGTAVKDADLAGPGRLIVPTARFFWINWILLLLNLLPGFPLDGGRLFQCALWPRLGFREATRLAVIVGFLVMLGIGIWAICANETLLLLLALFIYVTCRQQYILLETGGEESLFGYDFSQGYTSLERDQPPLRRRPGFIKRWLQKRAALRLQREQETRENEERRMDLLLEKVQREGLQALSEEERRFLTRVSARYRNRH
jgi:stage IV sporulation protein FB